MVLGGCERIVLAVDLAPIVESVLPSNSESSADIEQHVVCLGLNCLLMQVCFLIEGPLNFFTVTVTVAAAVTVTVIFLFDNALEAPEHRWHPPVELRRDILLHQAIAERNIMRDLFLRLLLNVDQINSRRLLLVARTSQLPASTLEGWV